jgi:crossover junction endodeoxyribonuclease RuvC
MNKIMGIDLSLVETGIICLEDGEITLSRLVKSKPSDEKEIERIQKIARQVTESILSYKPDLIVIEGLSYGSKNSTSLCQLAKLNFSVEIFCYQMGHRYLMVPPTTLKKFITGKGNAKKEVMLMKILKKYDLEFDNNNLADAFALAKYGEKLIEEVKKNGN